MLKLLKKISLSGLFLAIFIFFVSVQNFAYAEQEGIPVMSEDNSEELVVEEHKTRVKDLDIDPINTDSVKKSVVPDTRKEGRKLIGLFLKTMLLVFVCALLLYVILYFVKKFQGSTFVPSDEEYEDATMLELVSPETKTEALKSFLNRTK